MNNHASAAGERSLAQRVAARLREARLAALLTQREAARRAGLSNHSLLHKYETGAIQPSFDTLQRLAAAYGLTAAALLAQDDAAVPVLALLDAADPAVLAQLSQVLGAMAPTPTSPDAPLAKQGGNEAH